MKKWAQKQTGFTIVELLVVIVVIAILAAITIAAYNGIRERAQISSVQTQLSQAMKKVQANAILNGESYPATLADAGVQDGAGVTYQYTSDNTTSPKKYCITATLNTNLSYYISSTTGSVAQTGICPGHNLLVWYEDVPGAVPPIATFSSGSNVDTSVFRGGTASIRISPSTNQVGLINSPVTLTSGQTLTISFWMKTDSGWNGTSGNSKVRVGNPSSGSVLKACSYEGVKLTWTQITCSYTITSVTQVVLSVGNDGTTGQIWIDDLSYSVVGP